MSYETTILPQMTLKGSWREIWTFRELFYFLAWKDILVRYKQTVMGVAWSVLRPIIGMVILSVIFGRLAKLPSGDIPYPLLVYAGMLPWQFFSEILTTSGNSLVANRNMITKVYFPRIIVPSTSVVVSLVDFAISFLVFAVLMLWFGVIPDWRIAALPLLLLLAATTALGAGYWISALNVTYRDFRHIVPFMVRFGLYITPVGFSSDIVPGKWRLLYSLNPMVGVIDGFRWALLGKEVTFYLPGFLLSTFIAVAVLVSGIIFFNRTERGFADII